MFDKHNDQNKEKISIFKNAYSFLLMIINKLINIIKLLIK